MIIYKPSFTDHWIIETLNTDDLRLISGVHDTIDKHGTIRNNNFFTTEAGARQYIAKEARPDGACMIFNQNFKEA